MENIGYKYYIVFCCLLVIFLAVTYFYFPETKGRSLEEIAEIFDTEKQMNKNLYEERIEERIEKA
jgi:hypothetical protein